MTAPDPQDIENAARLLQSGRLVAFPTETVYGLGADATEAFADARAALVSDMEVRLLSTIDGDT